MISKVDHTSQDLNVKLYYFVLEELTVATALQILLYAPKVHISHIKVKVSALVALSVIFVRNLGCQCREYVRRATFVMLQAFNMELCFAQPDTSL